MNGFFAMGGYAAYVWPAYAATVVLLGGAAIATLRAYAHAKRNLARLEKP